MVALWKSSLDVLERYLEAVAAALLTTVVRRNAREIDTLDSADTADAKDKIPYTFEKCHRCVVGLSYAAQTYDTRQHGRMGWRLKSHRTNEDNHSE